MIAHRDFFPTDLKPGPKLLIACILADREQPGFIGRHPFAQVHIVQNPEDSMVTRLFTLWRGYYVPYWSQPGLIPRDPTRDDRFETAAFFGYEHNLAAELKTPEWQNALQYLGLTWRVVSRHDWHDYSNVDVVVAVRSFTDVEAYVYKPSSKLHNAWLAGVPVVLGGESAFRASRMTTLDYIDVGSPDEAITALRRLRDDPALRRQMRENGLRRAFEIAPERVVQLWRGLLSHEIQRAYERWCSVPDRVRSVFLSLRAKAFHRVMTKRDPKGIFAATYPRSPGPISK